jgi:hypothetical protein
LVLEVQTIKLLADLLKFHGPQLPKTPVEKTPLVRLFHVRQSQRTPLGYEPFFNDRSCVGRSDI